MLEEQLRLGYMREIKTSSQQEKLGNEYLIKKKIE
jgi:hypothetical protein